ncbi:hypothetical protein GGR38_004783 [Novosphingobium sediminicola]|uniref:Uncharacterized protein n=1 Tax=Novosphingobium sediminicola TaxID=563162 RepID=A0A7W6G8W2_9SPHN|nr:hypothetical protein [Novosphingobium sediminicola]
MGPQDIIKAVGHPHRITRISHTGRETSANSHRAFGLPQQKSSAIRVGRPPSNAAVIFAVDRWNRKSQRTISAFGGSGVSECLAARLV